MKDTRICDAQLADSAKDCRLGLHLHFVGVDILNGISVFSNHMSSNIVEELKRQSLLRFTDGLWCHAQINYAAVS